MDRRHNDGRCLWSLNIEDSSHRCFRLRLKATTRSNEANGGGREINDRRVQATLALGARSLSMVRGQHARCYFTRDVNP
jgi:hypothetical protein